MSKWNYLKYDNSNEDSDWRRVKKENPCPICDQTNKACLFHHSENKAICTQVASSIEISSPSGFKCAYLHLDAEIDFDIKEWSSDVEEAYVRASDDDCDYFYKYVIETNPLSKKHKKYLQECGIQDTSDFGTLEARTVDEDRFRCREVPNNFSYGIAGLFSSRDGQRQYLNLQSTGLIKAIRSIEGKIVGIEIRLDDKTKKRLARSNNPLIYNQEAKYMPLTSSKKHNGIKADVKRYYYFEGESKEELWITEGGKKGQILNEQLKKTCIAVRGVGIFAYVIDDIFNKLPECKKIVIAYDIDHKNNDNVRFFKEKLQNELMSKGLYDIYIADWESEYDENGKYIEKGIDDALNKDITIKEIKLSGSGKMLSLEEGAIAMNEKANEILNSKEAALHVIKATVGGGKTTSYINAINEAQNSGNWFKIKQNYKTATGWASKERDARVLWLTDDNYELLKETYNRFDIKPDMMMGRSEDESSKFYCIEKDSSEGESFIDMVGRSHRSIMDVVCKQCPLLKEKKCTYINETSRIMEKSKFVIGVKKTFLNRSKRLEEFDIIIIDESLTDYIYETKNISLSDIDFHLDLINYARKDAFFQSEVRKRSLDLHEMQLEYLKTEIESADCSETIEFDFEFSMDKAYHDHYKNYSEAPNIMKSRFPKDFIEDLPKSKLFIKDRSLIMNVPAYNIINTLKDKLVINLDATPSLKKLSVFKELNVHEYKFKEYMTIYQTQNIYGSKRSVEQKDTDRFLSAIEAIYRKDPEKRTVVLSTKNFCDILKKYMVEHDFYVDCGWYGNHTRGFNKFSSADNLVLVGNYCRNLDFMDMQQKTLDYIGVRVSLEDLIEEDTINEMVQAIGRGRGVRRKDNPLDVFVLSSRNLPAHYNVVPVKTIEKIYKGREYDQQSSNKKEAERIMNLINDYVNNAFNGDLFQIPSLKVAYLSNEIGVSQSTCKKHLVEIYKNFLLEQAQIQNEEYIEFLSSHLQQVTEYSLDVLGIEFTRSNPLVLNKYNTYDLKCVIHDDTSLRDHIYGIVPIKTNPLMWASFLDEFMMADKNDLKISTLSENLGYSRPVIKKYFNILSEEISLYYETRPNIFELDNIENFCYIKSWVTNAYFSSPEDLSELSLVIGSENNNESILFLDTVRRTMIDGEKRDNIDDYYEIGKDLYKDYMDYMGNLSIRWRKGFEEKTKVE